MLIARRTRFAARTFLLNHSAATIPQPARVELFPQRVGSGIFADECVTRSDSDAESWQVDQTTRIEFLREEGCDSVGHG
ncbi:MAG: hypothetical protein RLZZ436_4343 [Planctomycetota bacterium]|jgi:hypothetical protein